MKKLSVILFLIISISAVAQKSEKKISVVTYAGTAFLENNGLIGVGMEYHINKHSIIAGPYFTKTYSSNLTPGLHTGYSYSISKIQKKIQSLIVFDYLYFNAIIDPASYEKKRSIRHNFNIGYGIRYKFRNNFFAFGSIGMGKAFISDKNTDNNNTLTKEWWGQSIFSKIGIGYSI